MTDVSSSSSTSKGFSRNWCFTLHTDDDKFNIPSLFKQPPGKFMVAQLEIAPSTQKLHIQGYIQFNASKTLNQVRTYFDPYKPHLEPSKGNAQSNIAYCTKNETRAPNTEFVLLGDIPKRAAKTVTKPTEKKKPKPPTPEEIKKYEQKIIDEELVEFWEEQLKDYVTGETERLQSLSTRMFMWKRCKQCVNDGKYCSVHLDYHLTSTYAYKNIMEELKKARAGTTAEY